MVTKYYRHDSQDLPGPHVRRGMPEVELEILCGRAQNRIRLVREPAFLIGSASDCDLVLGDPQFPEAHSYLLLSPEDVTLRWLGMGPDVMVNAEPVVRSALEDGDLLEFGPYKFRISIRRREPAPTLATPGIQDGGDFDERLLDDYDFGGGEIRNLLAAIRKELSVGQPASNPFGRPQIRRIRTAS
jgi:hypothetical protein